MDSPYPVKRVALIKSTNGAEAQDRYATLLKEHEFISFSVPTLTFQFQLDDLSHQAKYAKLGNSRSSTIRIALLYLAKAS